MIKRIKRGTVNCHLLTGKGGSILIDACNPSDATFIYERVKDENVRLIVLTHGHPDHIGGAAELARRLSVPVAMGRGDAELLEPSGERPLHTHTLMGRMLKRATNVLVLRIDAAVCPDIWLEDGDDLSEYGVEAKVIALPGHTRGSIGVLAGTGDFFVGDALFNILRPTGALLYEDREQMERSVDVIARSRATHIHVGHGRPIPTSKIH